GFVFDRRDFAFDVCERDTAHFRDTLGTGELAHDQEAVALECHLLHIGQPWIQWGVDHCTHELIIARKVCDLYAACTGYPVYRLSRLSAQPVAANGAQHMATEPLIAVFIDFENLALGVKDVPGGDFDMRLIQKRVLEKGRIVFKRAYCDWSH